MLVIGNGPSLNETPLEDFGEVPAIGMNKINLLFKRSSWRPAMILCANRLVMQLFASSEIPIYLSWNAKRTVPKTARAISSSISSAHIEGSHPTYLRE